ncbi:sulfurtransferase [Ornithinibacillus salinisoli]|uniref:Sulfurtransferase n=1 Tax=Ornithinibacillus salinisoli TaxID=1848459 RepID=A0ABW4VXA3_9BACI
MMFLIDAEQLEKLQTQNENIVIVDVRFQLQDPSAGRIAYESGHIPGAAYLDLNNDLSGKVYEHGGKHPLPNPKDFAQKLGEIGIDQDTTVVVYDQHNDMFASRLWWLLQYMGHEKVYLLDGGFAAWIAKGYETSIEVPMFRKKTFQPNVSQDQIVDVNRIKENIESADAILIDSRAKDRYLGKEEPLYKKAGHIPGAKNFFWKNVLREDGSWKTEEELREHFASLNKDDEIIVSCGSGVSACPNILALKRLGYKNVKLYPGSFSDWISYEDNRVEKRDE